MNQFFYELLPLISFIVLVFLASLAVRSNWRSFTNRIFSYFLLAMAMWGFLIFGMRSREDLDAAFQWERLVIPVIPFVGVFFYHFSILITRTQGNRQLLVFFYLFAMVFVALSPTELVVEGMVKKSYGNAPEFGPLFPLYLLSAYLTVFMGALTLARAYSVTSSREQRNRFAYILIGAGCSLVGATTDILAAQEAIPYPGGMIGNIAFASFATVALLRLRLLELRVVLRRGLAYTLASSLIVVAIAGVFLSFTYIFKGATDSARFLASIGAAILVAIILQPLLGRFQTMVDRWFYRERYDHLKALQEFSLETKDITNLDKVATSLIELASRAMRANSAVLLLPTPSGDFTVTAATGLEDGQGLSLGSDSPFLRWLRPSEGIVTIRELDTVPHLRAMPAADRDTLVQLQGELFVPMRTKGELTGILVLGPKIAEEDYAAEDVDLLWTAVNQTAMVIENARMYAQEAERLARLENLEQLKQTLLLTVSHELKTPITAIKAGAEMLEAAEEAAPNSAKARLLRSINSGVSRLERLIDESLDYAKMQDATLELDMQPCNAREFVTDVVGLVSPAIRAKRQELEVILPDDAPSVLVDRRRAERILINLLSNANKHTPVGTSITLRMEAQEPIVLISVTDNGPGISDVDKERVFNAYYRNSQADGKGAGQSSGLGLSIAKYLAELHGGRIWLASELGKGTTFYFSLPLGGIDEDTGD
ncbi:MAG: GAF domain-containing protein [Chloroflexi bacterium]|nr:GAF domain-containing protein [Chloroflexota bacterium]